MVDSIKKWLWLKGYVVYGIQECSGNLEVEVRPRAIYRRCPRCHKLRTTCHNHRTTRKILHALWGNHAVYLVGQRNQRRCLCCKKVFTERWPGVKKWARISRKGQKDVLGLVRNQSLSSVEHYGISKWKVRYLLSHSQIQTDWHKEYRSQSFCLGIDEHSFRGREMVISITNLTHHQLKTILPDDRQETLKNWLKEQIPEELKAKLKEVCIDMRQSFKTAVHKSLPKTKIVVDPFHLIQDANRRVDEARRLEQEIQKRRINKLDFLIAYERLQPHRMDRLKNYLEHYPGLQPYHWIKEQLRKMYKAKDKQAATEILSELISTYEIDNDPEIELWMRTLKRWKPYILNHFIQRTTNAFTEGMHTKIKLIKRLSFGFSNVKMYIRKMLLACVPLALLWNGFRHHFC